MFSLCVFLLCPPRAGVGTDAAKTVERAFQKDADRRGRLHRDRLSSLVGVCVCVSIAANLTFPLSLLFYTILILVPVILTHLYACSLGLCLCL